jgi:hypothetical protein
MTPLAKDELTGPRGESYRKMIKGWVAGRAGTPDEVANLAALLMGPDGGSITGSDFLMDGGVTAAYWILLLPPQVTGRSLSPIRTRSRDCSRPQRGIFREECTLPTTMRDQDGPSLGRT